MAAVPRDVAGPERAAKPRFYLPELDSLRFFAVLDVFLGHTIGCVPAHGLEKSIIVEIGNFGVDLFFVLSAFLITELLQRERSLSGRIEVGSFYLRRALRIWPLYFVFLGTLFALRCFLIIPLGYFPFFVLFLGNLSMYLNRAVSLSIAPLWSVSLEEQFYAVWPLALRLARQARTIVMLAVTLWAFSICFRIEWFLNRPHRDLASIWYSSFARLDPIACGILISVLNGTSSHWLAGKRLMLFSLGVGFWLLAALSGPHSGHPKMICMALGYPAIALGGGAFLLSILGTPSQRLVSSSLTYLGRISYGFYVFHGSMLLVCAWLLFDRQEWIKVVGTPVLAFTATLLLAMASYRWLESPFLRLKRRYARIESGTSNIS